VDDQVGVGSQQPFRHAQGEPPDEEVLAQVLKRNPMIHVIDSRGL
jgi:hypothetical protein